MAKKTAAELRAENTYLRTEKISEGITSVLNRLIMWGGLVFIARYAYLSLTALAGKHTVTDVVIAFLGQLTLSQTVAYAFGGGGVAYGLAQRKLRRDTIERLQKRNRELEEAHDPKRSSSKLTTRGTTHPEDEK